MTGHRSAPPVTMRLLAVSLTASALVAGTVPAPAIAESASPTGLRGARLFRAGDASATRSVLALRSTSPGDARLVALSARQPQALWMTGGTPAAVRLTVAKTMQNAVRARGTAVFVLYNIPYRTCSGEGARSSSAYRAWIDGAARGMGTTRAAVILEPDALAHLSCLSSARQRARTADLAWAVARLRRQPGVTLYIDAGHSRWQSAATMAARLRAVGVNRARGFSLNVSNFNTTADETSYGQEISALLGGSHFVIDTGRNGLGPATGSLAWCNPPARALGAVPTTNPAAPEVDALLWVKRVGESDGSCRSGEPRAGRWFTRYLLSLAKGARW